MFRHVNSKLLGNICVPGEHSLLGESFLLSLVKARELEDQ